MNLSARQQGLVNCDCCGLLQQQQATDADQQMHCQRCGSVLHSRHPQSIAKSWALSLAALVMLFPANLYPIMTVDDFRGQSQDTIMSGIIYLIHSGQYPIAAVVFIASIAVPVLKLIGMAVLLIATQRRRSLTARQCTLMFRMVEFIGRWSMLDLFVIAILMALVNLDPLAKIGAGPAATAFLSAVILTMLAAMNFDPRLLWDLQQQPSSSKDCTLNQG